MDEEGLRQAIAAALKENEDIIAFRTSVDKLCDATKTIILETSGRVSDLAHSRSELQHENATLNAQLNEMMRQNSELLTQNRLLAETNKKNQEIIAKYQRDTSDIINNLLSAKGIENIIRINND